MEKNMKQLVSAISEILDDMTRQVANFLSRHLPELEPDAWWTVCVLNNLSEQQYQRIVRSPSHQLDNLDLAALLRILDRNWFELYKVQPQLSFDAKNYLKETQAIRNRWANKTATGFAFDDIYRDIDTLNRFAGVIHADEAMVEKLRQLRHQLLQQHPENKHFPEDGSTVVSPQVYQASVE